MTQFLSVITVVRNDPDGLARTRASLEAQDGNAFEWIVVDGASTDETLAALEGADPSRLTVLSEPDRGLYDAMNKGLGLARNEYVCFLNAGDSLVGRDVLRQLATEAERLDRPDILFAGQVKRYPNGQDLEVPAHEPHGWVRYSLPASHQACFIKRGTHLKTPYDLSYRATADYHAVALMYAKGASVARSHVTAVFSDKGVDSHSYRHPYSVIAEAARVQREVFGLSRSRVAFDAIKRLMPIVFWRLSSHIPHLVYAAEIAGRGQAVNRRDQI